MKYFVHKFVISGKYGKTMIKHQTMIKHHNHDFYFHNKAILEVIKVNGNTFRGNNSANLSFCLPS